MTLYELTKEYQDLLAMLEDEDADEQAINDTLELIALDIEEKAEGYGMVLKQMQADAEALKNEKMRLARRQTAIERNYDRLRERLKYSMLITGKTKIKTKLFTFGTQTRWKAFIDVAEDRVPEEFQKIYIKADTTAIEKWLKDGSNSADCDWAHLEPVDILTVR